MTRGQYDKARARFYELAPGFNAEADERDFLPSDRKPYRHLTLELRVPTTEAARMAAELVCLLVYTDASLNVKKTDANVLFWLSCSRALDSTEVAVASEATANAYGQVTPTHSFKSRKVPR